MLRGLIIAVVGIVAFGMVPSASPASALAGASCQQLTVPVSLAPGVAQDQTVQGILCLPDAPYGSQVDILLHGSSYNKTYWDWPVNQPVYSYVQRTLEAGRAIFAYDRLGVGQSSRPASLAVTVESDAFVLHQIIHQLRTIQGFTDVTTIGHSLGSVVAQYEAGAYKDVDRLVVTGLMHAQGTGVGGALTGFYPAALDPQFAGLTDLGYLTTTPGSRSLFYNETADPQVIAYDEAHKDVVSATQLAQSFPFTLTPPILNVTSQITAPVLAVVGDEDALICGLLLDCKNPAAVQANEAPYYPHAASLTTAAIYNTGHNLALHPSASQSFTIINQWIKSH